MRQLASVVIIDSVEPIENAHVLELAKVGGWQAVVQKGRFKPGDIAVFLEIDSIPPDKPIYEFLWRTKMDDYRPRPTNFRVRTIKLRGVLSQGVLFRPVEIEQAYPGQSFTWEDGLDLTEQLQVQKYEPPDPCSKMSGNGIRRDRPQVASNWPAFIPKTDECRVQNKDGRQALKELQGCEYYIAVKYDGTSATYYIDPTTDQFHACSRNWSVKDEPSSVYWQLARKYDIEKLLRVQRAAGNDIVIQGEACGPGIQGNPLGLKEPELFVFNVLQLDSTGVFTVPTGYVDMGNLLHPYKIPRVALLECGAHFDHTQESLLALAEGKYAGTNQEREGIVIRAADNIPSIALSGKRISFKAISNRFLLKGGT